MRTWFLMLSRSFKTASVIVSSATGWGSISSMFIAYALVTAVGPFSNVLVASLMGAWGAG